MQKRSSYAEILKLSELMKTKWLNKIQTNSPISYFMKISFVVLEILMQTDRRTDKVNRSSLTLQTLQKYI
jgi:hypothetical protein